MNFPNRPIARVLRHVWSDFHVNQCGWVLLFTSTTAARFCADGGLVKRDPPYETGVRGNCVALGE
ncbi:hypothetical protein D9M68_967650 [compost metagenome]